MKFLRIRDWERLQHYKHRSPPWIKLHRDVLRSQTWVTGDDASRTLAIALMMLAAENDNCIPFDSVYVQRAAYLNAAPNFDQLIATGFIEVIESDASGMLASRKHDASNMHTNALPEKRRGEESRVEKPALTRIERDRRERLTKATLRGLRNLETHPREYWEVQRQG